MTLPSAAAAFGRILVDELARGGVREAVLAPGSRSAPLALALAADERVRLHVRHDERSAAFLALGLARGAGRPVPLVCTSGTAAANFHPAVIEADRSSVPLLVLSADRPPELRDTGANQTIDQVKLYGASVRWYAEAGVPTDAAGEWRYWRSLASRAVAEARGALRGPPGPVHLNCALREPLVDDDAVDRSFGGRPDGAPWVSAGGGGGATTATGEAARPAGVGVGGGGAVPAEADVEAVTSLFTRHARGVIVAGDVHLADPTALSRLAAAVGWPVIAEPMSSARSGPTAVRLADAILRAPRVSGQVRPTAALVLGRVGLSRAVLGLIGAAAEQVLVASQGGLPDPGRAAGRVVVADPDRLLAAAADRVAPRESSVWSRWWPEASSAAGAAVDALLDAADAPSEPRTARDLAAWVPEGGLLVAASSMPIRDLDLVASVGGPGPRVLASRGASGIDGFGSTAVGAALAWPGPTAALAGDLSLIHDVNGLLLAGQPTPDLPFVVVNNDGGGIFSFLPQAALPEHFERVFGTPHGLDLGALVRAYGAGHRRLQRAGELPALLDAARSDGGIQVVEVRTDRSANVALHERMRTAVAAALPAPPAG